MTIPGGRDMSSEEMTIVGGEQILKIKKGTQVPFFIFTNLLISPFLVLCSRKHP